MYINFLELKSSVTSLIPRESLQYTLDRTNLDVGLVTMLLQDVRVTHEKPYYIADLFSTLNL